MKYYSYKNSIKKIILRLSFCMNSLATDIRVFMTKLRMCLGYLFSCIRW